MQPHLSPQPRPGQHYNGKNPPLRCHINTKLDCDINVVVASFQVSLMIDYAEDLGT